MGSAAMEVLYREMNKPIFKKKKERAIWIEDCGFIFEDLSLSAEKEQVRAYVIGWGGRT